MSTTYQVQIKPVQENRETIIDIMLEYIGPNRRAEAERLAEEGGTVLKDLNEEAAREIKNQLEEAGAEARSVPEEEANDQDRANFTVSGEVTLSNGEPAAGVTIGAYDRDLRSRQLLGEATTDEGGQYEIVYTRDQFRRAEKGRADLVLLAFNSVGTELNIETNRENTIFNAESEERVNLQITSDELITPSEYEQLVQALSPLLEGVALADLTTEDIDFLHRDTGHDAARIRFLAEDAQLSQEHDLPEAVFYGLARMGLGVDEDDDARDHIDLATLLERNNETLREGLLTALENNLIPARLRDSLDNIIARFDSLREEQQEREKEAWPQYELTGRLLDEETGEPLVGYAVSATDEDPEPDRDLGQDMTDADGRFTFSYRTPPDSDRIRPIRLTAMSQDGEKLDRRLFDVRLDQPEELEWRISLPKLPNPGEDISIRDVTVGIPDDAIAELEEKGVKTLSDVRSFGDLKAINGIGDVRAKELRAHADLSILSSDGLTRASLIENRFMSPIDIARTPRGTFTLSVEDDIEEPGRLYNAAVAAKRTVDNIITDLRTNRANGIRQHLEVDWPNLEPMLPDKCTCRDCESALSPGAYLADLARYVRDNVTEDESSINLPRLEELFHQPFGDLPVSCEASQKKVRQVRICIEILLRHLDADEIEFLGDATSEKGGKYLITVYETLLNQIGTSREELRLALKAGEQERRSLANRLGIAMEHLDKLLLEPVEMFTDRDVLTEGALEELFRLPAFTEWESSDGLYYVKPVDPLRDIPESDLQKWQIEHLRQQWKVQDHPADPYTNSSRGRLPFIDPDVIGPDDFRSPDPDDSNAFKIWRNRRHWLDEQLEELRNEKETDTNGGDPFEVPKMDALFDIMQKKVEYQGIDGNTHERTPWNTSSQSDPAPKPSEFDNKLRTLREGTDAETVRKQIQNHLHLTVESFTRLVELWQKHRKWDRDDRYPRVTDAEREEIFSILVQAQKRAFYNKWNEEEDSSDVVFGPGTFWMSLLKPEEGTWSLAQNLPEDTPFIDPEVVDLDELPEPTFGKTAIELWKEREKQLDEKRSKLRDEYERDGFGALAAKVYGQPPSEDNWASYFKEHTVEKIAEDLDHTDEDAARKLKSVAAKDTTDSGGSSNLAPPSDDELDEVFNLLTTAWKLTSDYWAVTSHNSDNWVDVEENKDLRTYWKVRKAQLPEWRASRTDRQQWQQALRRRSQRPIIDPDQLVPGNDLVNPTKGNPAYDLWKERNEKVKGKKGEWGIEDATGITSDSQLSDTQKLNGLVKHHIGVELEILTDFKEREEEGQSIDDRLDQLTLERRAFNYLLDVRDRIDEDVDISQSTWEEVVNIVVNVSKKRRFAEWNDEEREKVLTLSPEYFRLANRKEILDRFDDESPKWWRISLGTLRDWRDTLEARIEQQDQIKAALREAVSQAEEETLTILRDALIERFEQPSEDAFFGEKADWASQRFLIDTEESGCRKTTRVSQATESLQTLLFHLDTGQDTGGLAQVDLQIKDDQFDKQWKWLKTYPKWKAAKGVYLYPENVLLPTLKNQLSPMFQQIVEDFRTANSVSDSDALRQAEDYATYFR